MSNRPTISLPQGVRDILPDEARKISEIESKVLPVFADSGFESIRTPMLEYVDVLSLGMGRGLQDQAIKFIDPSTARVVAMRPDTTAQIARVVATRMRKYPFPIKLCYNQSVVRYPGAQNSKSREIQQIGAEHFSTKTTPEADADMISMAIQSLKALGLKSFMVDIGDVAFLRTILDNLGVTEEEASDIKEAIAIKDSSELSILLEGSAISKADKELLIALTTFYGEGEVIERAKEMVKGSPAEAVLDNLSRVYSLVCERGHAENVTIDLGEVRGFDYYTGTIFEGFASGVGSAILSGGRYDNLLEQYGHSASATGFAFDVENIVAALDAQNS